MSAPPTSEKHQKTLAGFFEKRKAQSSEDGAEMCDDDAAREEGGNQKEEQTTTTTTENNSPTQQKENIEGAAKKRKLVRKSEVLYANAKTSSSAEQTKLDNAKNLELQQQDKQPKTSEGLQHTKEKEDDEKEPKKNVNVANLNDENDEEYKASRESDDEEEEEEDDDDEIEDIEGPLSTSVQNKAKKTKSKNGKEKSEAGVGALQVELAQKYISESSESIPTWKENTATPFGIVADTFENIAETTKRLEITNLLTNTFRSIIRGGLSDDLLAAVYLASNTIAPQHQGIDLGIGDATLIKCLAEATGRKEANIKADYREAGDLGSVAMASRSTQRTMFQPAPLTVKGVLQEFRVIATTAGTNSVDQKKGRIKKLLVAAKGSEAGYIVRALQGKLRIGLAQQTVNAALTHAIVLEANKTASLKLDANALADELLKAVDIVKLVFSECPSYDLVVPALLDVGIDGLQEKCQFKPGAPVKPMLAKPTTGVAEVLNRFSDVEFTCEYKYDGERAQVHLLEDGSIKIFSRNQEDNTPKFPDIVSKFKNYLNNVDGKITSVVIDCEAVAYDREQDKILPFQILSTRGKKNIKIEDVKVQVALYAFDCLYLNGKSLLREPMSVRRRALYNSFSETKGEFLFATAKTSKDVEELQVFLDESIAANTEGLIVKTMDATYEPSKRSLNWLKLKKDYMEGCGDSLDLVPIGAWHGRGKRTGVYGAFLLACYDEDGEEFQTICKIGTGFSEVDLETLSKALEPHLIEAPRSYYKYPEGMAPDLWFDAKLVWEVKAADLSISPTHKAAMGLVDPNKGIALRFPRFLRSREDKEPEMATNAHQVADFYNAQANKQTFEKE
jgi:DNA ligase-1|tara:strand:+ start:1965 stop:4499 length:2535 start_codon:yes stop_codon:yes gene_type:complete